MALNRSWRMSFKVYLFYTVLNIIYQICVQDLGAKIIFARRAKMGEFCGQTQKFVKTQISFCVFAIYLAPLRMTKSGVRTKRKHNLVFVGTTKDALSAPRP